MVAEARTWIATPYHRMAQVKGVGVDCAQLPLAVYAAVGIIPPTAVAAYSSQWNLHKTKEVYLGHVRRFAAEIDPATVREGDFLIWRYGLTFSHGGIVCDADPLSVIHAFARARKVTIDRVADHAELSNLDRIAFSPWGG